MSSCYEQELLREGCRLNKESAMSKKNLEVRTKWKPKPEVLSFFNNLLSVRVPISAFPQSVSQYLATMNMFRVQPNKKKKQSMATPIHAERN
jgi:hypothetical protein